MKRLLLLTAVGMLTLASCSKENDEKLLTNTPIEKVIGYGYFDIELKNLPEYSEQRSIHIFQEDKNVIEIPTTYQPNADGRVVIKVPEGNYRVDVPFCRGMNYVKSKPFFYTVKANETVEIKGDLIVETDTI